MPLSFNCPQCGKSYTNVGDQYAGKRMKCKCGKVMRLGAASPKASTPAAVKPVPVKPIPVKPVPVKSLPSQTIPPQESVPATAPVQPLVPINEVADPIFGSGQKINSAPVPPAPVGGDDLLNSLQPPPPANPFETAYAPPAPISRPHPSRTRRRRHKSAVGPTMSIISGGLGTLYGLVCLGFFALSVLGFVSLFTGANVTIPPQLIFSAIATTILMLLSIAITGSCGYSAITGIIELSNDQRKPGPSSMAGTTCMAFIVVTILLFVVSVIMSIALQTSVGQIGYNDANALGMVLGVLIGLVLMLLFLAVPIFVFCVGYFRNKSA